MKNLKEEIENITKAIGSLENKRKEYKEERVEECEFKIDEKVKVFRVDRWNKDLVLENLGEGFIHRISVNDEGDFSYSLKKCKKDGKKSALGFYSWYEYKIEKI